MVEHLHRILSDVPPDRLDCVCPDQFLVQVANHVSNWQRLPASLGLRKREQDKAKAQATNDPEKLKIEFLKTWREKHGRRATCLWLCKFLWEAEEVVLVIKARDVLQNWQGSFESPSLPEKSPSADLVQVRPPFEDDDSDVLDQYAHYIHRSYTVAIPHYFVRQWPPPPVSKVVDLTLTQIETHHVHASEERFDIEHCLVQRPVVPFRDLFDLEVNVDRQIVLVEGATGTGKSTLAWNICRKWKAYEMFKKFRVVVYINFKEQYDKVAKSIMQVLPGSPGRAIRQQAASIMEAYLGQDILFIVDGWDEYDPVTLKDSFLHKLIFTPEKVSLQFSTVLVTTRHIVSDALLERATTRIQVLGFTPASLNKYFEEAMRERPRTQKISEHLRESPQLEASCFVPMNAGIVAHIFLGLDGLPPTHFRKYAALVCSYIIRHLTKWQYHIPEVRSIKRLPPEAQEPFVKLCTLAYDAVCNKKVVLSSTDLLSFGVSTTTSELSMIQRLESLDSALYAFVDHSIQQLLAAVHISEMSISQQVQHFCENFNPLAPNPLIQCYAGLSELDPPGAKDVLYKTLQDHSNHMSVISCVYDSQNEVLAKKVATSLKNTVDGHCSNYTGLEYLALGYFLRVFCEANRGEFKVDLRHCMLDNYSVGFLTKELAKKGRVLLYDEDPNTIPPLPGYIDLDISHNCVHGSGLQRISAAVNGRFCSITKLNLSFNAIQEGEDGLKFILQGLKTNRYVADLALVSCGLQITEDNGPVLVETLTENTAMKKLDLSHNEIGDTGVSYIADGLSSNTALLELSLCHCGIGSAGAHLLSNVLSDKRILPMDFPRSKPGSKRHRDALQELHLHLYRCKLAAEEGSSSSRRSSLPRDSRLRLELYDSAMSDVGAAHMMRMMRHNPKFRDYRHSGDYHYFSESEFIPQGNGPLQVLNLSENKLTDAGASFLAEALRRNEKLQNLNVGDCRLTDQGVALLAFALETNTTLVVLSLDNNPISDIGLSTLGNVLGKNGGLKTLNLRSLEHCTTAVLKQLIASTKKHNFVIVTSNPNP